MNGIRCTGLASALGWSGPLAAGVAGSGDGLGGGQLAQLIGGLFVMLLAIAVLAWFARRLQALPARRAGALRVLGALPVGPRERVVLLQAGSTQLLIGVAPGQVRALHALAEPVAVDPDRATTPGPGHFAALLAAVRAGRS